MQIAGARLTYLKRAFHFWLSRDLGGPVKAGCFTQDARGRWYVSFQCEVAGNLPTGNGEVGIDLGLKTLAACTDGTVGPGLAALSAIRGAACDTAARQQTARVKAIHAKIANVRQDHLHKAVHRIVRENELIVVGNVKRPKLAKTRMAKSVLDASWANSANQLSLQGQQARLYYVEADERWTSQTCSCCGTIPVSSPKGMGALGVRHWTCSDCGAPHDRDVNAAWNILRVGARTFALRLRKSPSFRAGKTLSGFSTGCALARNGRTTKPPAGACGGFASPTWGMLNVSTGRRES